MPPSASTPSTSGTSVASTGADAPTKEDAQDYDTVWVPPPAGSLLGGGSVRVPKKNTGTGENALLSNIRHLNAAAGTQRERPYVVAAVSRATGLSERELQAQQDLLRLRFGELCAINAIARGRSNKVQEIATLKSQGKTWTDLARANGVSIAAVVQTTRNASEMAESSFSISADRQKGGNRKMHDLGVKSMPLPNG